MIIKNRKLTAKIALAVGVLFLIVWSILGAGTSLAWFTDKDEEIKNVFNFGEFDMEVSYRNDDMTEYAPLELDTNIFGEDSLYEPGYTEVVYLKVKNAGDLPFNYKLSIDLNHVTTAFGVLGNEIYLPNYLRYGVLFADSESLLTRELARENAISEMAELRFNTFSEYDSVTLEPQEERYVALVVYMPEEVDNSANYRGDTVPEVRLGVTLFAEQIR